MSKENAVGWLYYNPDTGIEFDTDHPINSGKVEDAQNVRAATATELLIELKMAWEVLEEERSAEAKMGKKWLDACAERDAAIARAESAERKLAKAVEALRPFSALRVTRLMTDGCKYDFRVDAAWIRRARATLAELEKD